MTIKPTPQQIHKDLSQMNPDELREFWALVNQGPPAAEQPAEEAPARFTVQWADSVYQEAEPLEFLVNGLITKGSVNLLVGEGGSKKTWAALDLAACVAMGKPWLDFQTQQTTVLLVDEESGPRRLKRRLFEVLNGHLAPGWAKVPIAFTSLSMLNLREPADVNELQLLIEETGAGLVIVDALADIMPGADENSVKDVQPVFMHLRAIAESTGAAILVIHHSNKQNGYRGSTAIKGAIDLMLMVDSAAESKYLSFKSEKARDIEPVTFTAVATWQLETEQFYLTASDLKPKTKTATNKSQRYVLRYLMEHTQAEVNELANAADVCGPGTAKRTLYDLAASGHAERTDPGGKGRGVKAIFQLTEKGRELASQELAEEGE
jgi:DNA-binding MarR family transcriptional regulator